MWLSMLSMCYITMLYTVVHAQETAPRIVHHPADVVVKVGNPATLSCRADGSPKPTIEWLRNGQPLETKGDGQLQPIVLSEGSIFFLSVGGGRRGQSHEGVYTCVARSSAGKATSRNASLYIAGETGDVERHLTSGERAGAGAGGGAVPARYSWAHLHAQHGLWNQAPGEGLDFVLFWSCPG
uniref:Ig-like domain-containing protein n=1 Tax=Cyclopterus lumpus TaxID=8103 RepID=A0A8C2ZIJ1_CYCLU